MNAIAIYRLTGAWWGEPLWSSGVVGSLGSTRSEGFTAWTPNGTFEAALRLGLVVSLVQIVKGRPSMVATMAKAGTAVVTEPDLSLRFES